MWLSSPRLCFAGARVVCADERVGQACENAFTDQSILNGEFRGGCRDYRQRAPCGDLAWWPLPLSYNVNVQMIASIPELHWRGAEIALVHFAGGYAKPWLPMPSRGSERKGYFAERLQRERHARQLWRRSCNASSDDSISHAAAFKPGSRHGYSGRAIRSMPMDAQRAGG